MYKKSSSTQLTFEDFNQPMGLHMNANNRWIQKAAVIPWAELEKEYAKNFKNKKGNVAKPFRMAFGALLIQAELGFSDEEIVRQIQENPYLQFFIGLPGYQEEKPFDSSTMVYFRKRLPEETMHQINEKIIAHHKEMLEEANKRKEKDDKDKDDNQGGSGKNKGTLMLDATCVPQDIKYPTDTEMLNDARCALEKIIDGICEKHRIKKPRTYREVARKVYLSVVKRKKKSKKWLRPKIRQLLSYVKRDLSYVQSFIEQAISLTEKQLRAFQVAQVVYSQQKEMYDNRTNSVDNRIVSFSQPHVRPIVRGKVRASVEFGAKIDMSVENGIARIERSSFDAFNECTDLLSTIERFFERNGYYPERVLVDKIYRNRENIRYCKEKGIRISGPSLGRPSKEQAMDKKLAYQDESDRVEVERSFSRLKRRFGLFKVRARLPETSLTTIGTAVVALNLTQIQAALLCTFFERFHIINCESFTL